MDIVSEPNERMTRGEPNSHSRRTVMRGLGAAGVLSVIAAKQPALALAQDASPEAVAVAVDDYPELELIAEDYSFTMPAEAAGGLTRVTLVNNGMEGHHAIFIQLNDGVTQADVDAAAANLDFLPMVQLGAFIGGPNGAPAGGGTSTMILDLAPGDYQVVCVIPDAEGIPHYVHGMIAPLTVTESASSLAPPTADLTIDLVDFEFDQLPAEIPSGQHVWELVNTGQEPHELVVFQIAPGVPFAVIEGIFGGEEPAAPAGTPAADAAANQETSEASPEAMAPPFLELTGISPMNPGFTNWLVADLVPGNYFAICFVPSPANGGAPHFALGMLMPFAVV